MSKYISKDYIHYGCGLLLNPEIVWKNLNYSVRNKINKAKKNNIQIKRVNGIYDNLNILKKMWYNPEDPNFPTSITENDYLFIAYLNQVPIGAMLLLPVSNHLFLNNIASTHEGKCYGVQDYLLWHSVNYFLNSEFKYIDVGVSYRKSLYDFFKKWAIFNYPVIFNKPEISRPTYLKPFQSLFSKKNNHNIINETTKLIENLLDTEKFTFVPNKKIAIEIIKKIGFEPLEITYSLENTDKTQYYFIDLTEIFSTQYGTLIVNLKIEDKDLWNIYNSLDYYKRNLVYTEIYDELKNLNNLIKIRNNNYDLYKSYFGIEDIIPIEKSEKIKSAFYFYSNYNEKYHIKLNEFEIEHSYNNETKIIGLPVHQNLKFKDIELIYAIFRGVLNLCSEWVHTDVLPSYK